MAATGSAMRPDQQYICTLCAHYFKDPRTLQCGHNFCCACIRKYWKGLGKHALCPLCQARNPTKRSLKVNKHLASMAALAKENHLKRMKKKQEQRCTKHKEKLKMFCKDDDAPICVVCFTSKEHKLHRMIPIDEAAEKCKKTIQSQLEPLKIYLENLKNFRLQAEQNAADVKEKVTSQKQRITDEFMQLKEFLEEVQCVILTNQEKIWNEVLQRIREKVTKLKEEESSLENKIRESEVKCQLPDLEMVKNKKIILSRCQHVKSEKPDPGSSEDEIDLHIWQKHAELQKKLIDFMEWRQCRLFAVDEILDAETAHPRLSLAEDMKSVNRGEKSQNLPDNPERFEMSLTVLGLSRLTSGKHYWEVDVGEKLAWALGVCDDSVSRRGESSLDIQGERAPKNGYWRVVMVRENDYVACSNPPVKLSPRVRPTTIGIFLDYEMGKISFFNLDEKACLFAFPPGTFPSTLRLYVNTCSLDKNALRLLPVINRSRLMPFFQSEESSPSTSVDENEIHPSCSYNSQCIQEKEPYSDSALSKCISSRSESPLLWADSYLPEPSEDFKDSGDL